MIRRLTQDLFWAVVIGLPLAALTAAAFNMID